MYCVTRAVSRVKGQGRRRNVVVVMVCGGGREEEARHASFMRASRKKTTTFVADVSFSASSLVASLSVRRDHHQKHKTQNFGHKFRRP